MQAFDKTLTTANTAEDFVTIPVGKKGRNISIVNVGPGKAWIHADVDATAALPSIGLDVGDTYSDLDLGVATRWSFIGSLGTQPRIRGVVWAGLA